MVIAIPYNIFSRCETHIDKMPSAFRGVFRSAFFPTMSRFRQIGTDMELYTTDDTQSTPNHYEEFAYMKQPSIKTKNIKNKMRAMWQLILQINHIQTKKWREDITNNDLGEKFRAYNAHPDAYALLKALEGCNAELAKYIAVAS
jgi:hypothetical protein